MELTPTDITFTEDEARKATPIAASMDLSANDEKAMSEINGGVKSQMESKIAESKQKFGFGAIAVGVGISKMKEVTNDYAKSYNFMRDTVCGGNKDCIMW